MPPPAVAHAWTSEGGLRYTWVLPAGFAPGDARTLIVLCHGTGLDYRWGSANYKPGDFRPADIILSVDGPTRADNGTRLFLGRPEDSAAFAAFLDEARRTFHPARTILYGHSQGSFFVVYFAGEHPELVDGIVAHASGAWTWSKTDGAVLEVPIAFMHGTMDPVVPFPQSPGARDHYRDTAGHKLVQLRRLAGYNHWPNAHRATECIDWTIGMDTADPAEALAAAERILEPKGTDEYGYSTPVWFSGAYDILRRFDHAGPRPFDESVSGLPILAVRAADLRTRIDAHAREHIDLLQSQMPEDGPRLDGGLWIGHLASYREDFRGVPPVEEFAARLGFDRLSARQPARPIFDAWYAGQGPASIYNATLRGLESSYLYEGYPPQLASRMHEWRTRAAELDIAKGLTGDPFRTLEMWESGWREGRTQYEDLCGRWSLTD